MTNELKPCPFCGGKASTTRQRWVHRDFWGVCCDGECGVFLDNRSAHEKDAIARWNLRSPATGAVSMREAAAKVCRDIYDKRIATSKAAARKGLYGKENDQAMMASGAHACLLAIEAIPAPEVPECHGCKHWTVDKQAKDFDKSNQYGTCRGMRGCGVEIETTGDCSVDAICTDATFCCKGWEAR